MPYTVTWDEAYPAGVSTAGLIWEYIQEDKIAVRERIDSIFGTSGFTSFANADPYLPISLTLKGGALSRIIPGPTSFSVRNTDNTQDNLLVEDDGDVTTRGTLRVLKAATAARIVHLATATTPLDLSLGNSHTIELVANITTLTLDNPVAGGCYVIHVEQAGSFTLAWPASIKWVGGVAPVVSSGGPKIDVFSFWYDGTDFFGTIVGQDFS